MKTLDESRFPNHPYLGRALPSSINALCRQKPVTSLSPLKQAAVMRRIRRAGFHFGRFLNRMSSARISHVGKAQFRRPNMLCDSVAQVSRLSQGFTEYNPFLDDNSVNVNRGLGHQEQAVLNDGQKQLLTARSIVFQPIARCYFMSEHVPSRGKAFDEKVSGGTSVGYRVL